MYLPLFYNISLLSLPEEDLDLIYSENVNVANEPRMLRFKLRFKSRGEKPALNLLDKSVYDSIRLALFSPVNINAIFRAEKKVNLKLF